MAAKTKVLAAILAIAAAGWAGGVSRSAGEALQVGRPAPELGGGPWINSAPLTGAALRGRVLLVEFWTYG